MATIFDELRFEKDIPYYIRILHEKDYDRVDATVVQLPLLSGASIYLREPTTGFWDKASKKGADSKTGQTPASVISHETLHSVLVEQLGGTLGFVASLRLDWMCNQWGWRYENSGLPDFFQPPLVEANTS